MKIGYLVHDMNPKAGWGKLSSDLISGIKAAGHEVVILKEIDDGFDGLRSFVGVWNVFITFVVAEYLAGLRRTTIDVYPYGIIALLALVFKRKYSNPLSEHIQLRRFITRTAVTAVASLVNSQRQCS
jgi:hypothetical protein